MEVKSVIDLLSLVASIASLVLAIVAIWLSVVFYRMSTKASEATTEAAKGIAASVERLEKLFDKLYSDTFSMMKETVTDMRRHIWPEEESAEHESAMAEVEGKADRKISELQQGIETQLNTVLAGQKIAEEKNLALQLEMRELIARAIRTSRRVEFEAREETVREHLLTALRSMRRLDRNLKVDAVVSRLSDTFPVRRVISEIQKLRDENLIELSPDEVEPLSEIKLIDQSQRARAGRPES